MLRSACFLGFVAACAAYNARAPAASKLAGSRTATTQATVPSTLRAAVSMESVASATYSLDNVVLDGPLQPLKDQILVKIQQPEKQTQGGLFLTSGKSDAPTSGDVVAAGPGKPHPHSDVLITNPVKAGDKVLFGEFSGTKVKYCLDEHVMLTVDEVLCTVVDDKLVPVRDRLMLKPIEKPVQTSAGIVLTNEAAKAQEVPNQGEVIATGEGRFTARGEIEPMDIKVGEKVMFTKYGGTEVQYKGEKFVFVFAADCLAKY
mmetsp:Transcript_22662/g.58299  ORF Transcript_22662/g.58299 Transcript_22662/m.58299 type:complete len:260 (-) Transcript_22662:220-999(-)